MFGERKMISNCFYGSVHVNIPFNEKVNARDCKFFITSSPLKFYVFLILYQVIKYSIPKMKLTRLLCNYFRLIDSNSIFELIEHLVLLINLRCVYEFSYIDSRSCDYTVTIFYLLRMRQRQVYQDKTFWIFCRFLCGWKRVSKFLS